MRRQRYLTLEQSDKFRKAIMYMLQKTHISKSKLADATGLSRQAIWCILARKEKPIPRFTFSAMTFGITYAMCIVNNMSAEEMEKLYTDSGLTGITDEFIQSHLKHTT